MEQHTHSLPSSSNSSNPWTIEEDVILLEAVSTHGRGSWAKVAQFVGRSEAECEKRYQYVMGRAEPVPMSLQVNTSLQVSNPLVPTEELHPGMGDLVKTDELDDPNGRKRKRQGITPGDELHHDALNHHHDLPEMSGSYETSSMTSGLTADVGHSDMHGSGQRKPRSWTRDEDALLKQLVEQGLKWNQIFPNFTDRSEGECRARWNTCLSQELNKGPWTSEEDSQLSQLVEQLGHVGPSRWGVIAKRMGTNRSKGAVKQRYEDLVRSGVIEDRLGLDKISQEDIGGDDFEVEEVADDEDDSSSKLHSQNAAAHHQFFYPTGGSAIGNGFDPSFSMHQTGMAAYQNHYYPSYAPMLQFSAGQPQYQQYQQFQSVPPHQSQQQMHRQQAYNHHMQFANQMQGNLSPQMRHLAGQQPRHQPSSDDDYESQSKRPKRERKPPKRDYDSMILSGGPAAAAPTRETAASKRTRRASTGDVGVPAEVAPVASPPTKKSSLAAAAAAAAVDSDNGEGKRRWNPWTPDEDALLVKLVQQHMSWKEIADHLPGRTKSDCQSRWSRHVNPEINKGPWTKAEDEKLIRLHKQLRGNVPEIAKQLGTNRTYLDTKRRLEKLNRGTAK